MSKGLPTRRKLTRCRLSGKEKVSARMSKRDPDGLVDRLDRRNSVYISFSMRRPPATYIIGQSPNDPVRPKLAAYKRNN